MVFLIPFFLGFIAAVIGVSLPGLINMTLAKISIQENKSRAIAFLLGALLIIGIQTWVALVFARYIDSNPKILLVLREISLGIFVVLSVYFLVIAKNEQTKQEKEYSLRSKKSRFFLGMFVSALNFFPIPYYVFVSIGFASLGWFNFYATTIYSFVFGVVLGSFLVFYAYIYFFKRIKNKTLYLATNMNKFIGAITTTVSILTLYSIIKYYCK